MHILNFIWKPTQQSVERDLQNDLKEEKLSSDEDDDDEPLPRPPDDDDDEESPRLPWPLPSEDELSELPLLPCPRPDRSDEELLLDPLLLPPDELKYERCWIC